MNTYVSRLKKNKKDIKHREIIFWGSQSKNDENDDFYDFGAAPTQYGVTLVNSPTLKSVCDTR